jgi:hypothetical protein
MTSDKIKWFVTTAASGICSLAETMRLHLGAMNRFQ